MSNISKNTVTKKTIVKMPFEKYKPFPTLDLKNRQWPSQTIKKAPIWCSVDLRDGNQALIEPMGADRKHRMFKMLVDMGYKQIEVGFPSASQTDFDFLRDLIEGNLIPDDVSIQVLTQARSHLIERTYEAIKGAKRAIVHLYNSTSTIQRNVVFKKDMAGIKKIAVDGAELLKQHTARISETEITYEYSPESFTQTEMDYALDVCEAVMDVFEASSKKPVIINLPATVEVSTPNIYADQIEWFCNNLRDRSRAIISIHPHNDRGTGIAAAEFALMAGADRIEGTLFGNGERTGNVDLVTLGMNMVSQGVDAKIDFSNIREIVATAEYCNQLPVHPRHPYSGELVFTAFSGSHQDAIKKGLDAMQSSNSGQWNVPYLPIDPEDVGADYEAVIRVNSQSGKGGIAYILEKDHGLKLPRKLQVEFSKIIQSITEATGKEISADLIWNSFLNEYLDNKNSYQFINHQSISSTHASEIRKITAKLEYDGDMIEINGTGNGPIDAYVNGLKEKSGLDIKVLDYSEHAVGSGADAIAVAYVEAITGDGRVLFGVGRDSNIVAASLKAVTCVFNRVIK